METAWLTLTKIEKYSRQRPRACHGKISTQTMRMRIGLQRRKHMTNRRENLYYFKTRIVIIDLGHITLPVLLLSRLKPDAKVYQIQAWLVNVFIVQISKY